MQDIIDCNHITWTPAVREGYARSGTSAQAMTEKFPMWERTYADAGELLARMDAAGVSSALLAAIQCGRWEVPPDVVAEMVATAGGRLHGLYGIDPRNISEELRKLEEAVRDHGFVGAHALPQWFDLAPDDRSMYPFYAKCVELDIPIQVQAALAFQPFVRNTNQPVTFDNVAVDFPELRMVCIHTGYPWERELVALAWKHPNLFIGADNFPARKWAPELVAFIEETGGEKVMFGTAHPALEMDEAVRDVLDLALEPDTQRNLFSETARRVFRLGT